MGSFCSEGDADRRLDAHYANPPYENLHDRLELFMTELDEANHTLDWHATEDMRQGDDVDVVDDIKTILELLTTARKCLACDMAARQAKREAKK